MDEYELKKLDKLARKIFGCPYDELDFEDQDTLYCMMMEGEKA